MFVGVFFHQFGEGFEVRVFGAGDQAVENGFGWEDVGVHREELFESGFAVFVAALADAVGE